MDRRDKPSQRPLSARVQPRIQKRVLVPQREHRLILRHRPTHPMHLHQLGIRQMPHQSTAGPPAHPGLRTEISIRLLIIEIEEATLQQGCPLRVPPDDLAKLQRFALPHQRGVIAIQPGQVESGVHHATTILPIRLAPLFPATLRTVSEKAFVQFETENGVGIAILLAPNLGSREAPIIKQEVLTYAPKVTHKVVLDFEHVTMMGSLALGVMVDLAKQCKAANGALALCNLNDDLRGVLKMSHLDRLLTITKDRAGAVRKIS